MPSVTSKTMEEFILPPLDLPEPTGEDDLFDATHLIEGERVRQYKSRDNRNLYFNRAGIRIDSSDRAKAIPCKQKQEGVWVSRGGRVKTLEDIVPYDAPPEEEKWWDEEFSPGLIKLCLDALTPGVGYSVDIYGNTAKMIDANTVRLSVYKGVVEGGHKHYLVPLPRTITLAVKVLEW